MLGKLIKHEMATTVRVMPIFYLIIVGLVAAYGLLGLLHIPIMQIMLLTLLIMACCGLLFGSLVYMVIRYYNSMFGREGYLTQTLPVTKGALLASRLLTSLFWLALSLLVCLGTALLLLSASGAPLDLHTLYSAIPSQVKGLLLYTLAAFCAQGVLTLVALYFSITLSHTRPFLKNSILFSAIWYVAISTILSILRLIAMLVVPVTIPLETGRLEWGLMLTDLSELFTQTAPNVPRLGVGSIFVDLAGIALLLCLTSWLLKRKTSVK